MNLYIYPKNQAEAAKASWVVKLLYLLGLLQVLACAILGALVGGPFIAVTLTQLGIMDRSAASASALFIGLAAGIIVGLITGLLFFALSQLLEDVHAIRVQTAGYLAGDADSLRPGR